MPTFTAANFGQNIISPQSAGEVMIMEDVVSLPVTLALNDIAKIGYLPAGCVPVDLMVHADELDSNATDTLRFSVGLLNADGDDLISGSAMLTGGEADVADLLTRGNGAGLNGLAPDNFNDRVVAVKITAAGATKAAGDLRVKMFYRASNLGA